MCPRQPAEDTSMRFVPLCELELRYTDVEFVDYGAGGQYYGHLEGTLGGMACAARCG